MIKKILMLLLSITSIGVMAQQVSTLKKQVSFCNEMIEEQESEIESLKKTLIVQDSMISSLKNEVATKEGEKQNLNEKIVDLESASVVLLKVATKLEEQDRLLEALDIFKLITEIYPGTLESSSANFKIKRIHEELRKRASAAKNQKK